MKNIRDEVLEEAEIIKHSGEIPEVAYWNSIYYLCEDEDGLKMVLNLSEKKVLKKAVIERYLTIIKRDLSYENIGKPSYRGLRRAIVNWQRLVSFLKKEGFPVEGPRLFVLEYLKKFLYDVALNKVSLDISREELLEFIEKLGASPADFPKYIADIGRE